MTDNQLTQQAEIEIRQLHKFFQDWYRGDVGHSDFQRFEQALHPDFQMVMPSGHALERERILSAVRGDHGSDTDATVEIRNVQMVSARQSTAIFSYEEWQSNSTETMRGRLSSVVFVDDDSAPNGLKWWHVHETWLPEE